MNYYTSTILATLAEKLKEKGMPIEIVNDNTVEHDFPIEEHCETIYGEIFDWLIEKEIFISLPVIGKLEDGSYRYEATISYDDAVDEEYLGGYTWHEAANAAIEKALTLI